PRIGFSPASRWIFPMSKPDQVAESRSPGEALARDLIERIDELLQCAKVSGQPIELDPLRSQLFELFLMSEATGFLEEGAAEDLWCDGVARALAERWNLARHLGDGGLAQAASLPPEQLSRLRLLWSFMRMWMEWTYAWKRWEEFHKPDAPQNSAVNKM